MTSPPTQPNPETIRNLHFREDGTIKPLPEAPHFFAVFALPPRLQLDLEATRTHFLELSRQIHPDFHANAPEAEREEILRRSALVNNAWKTLREPVRRAEYLIETFGREIKSDKGAVPPELLEEMFDIQEAGEDLREARLAADGDALKQAEDRVKPLRESVTRSRKQLMEYLEGQFVAFDSAAEAAGGDLGHDDCQKIMQEIRLTLDRLNYLRTVLRNLK